MNSRDSFCPLPIRDNKTIENAKMVSFRIITEFLLSILLLASLLYANPSCERSFVLCRVGDAIRFHLMMEKQQKLNATFN